MTSVEEIPGTYKAHGVLVARSEERAKEILLEHAESISLDLTLVAQTAWDASVRIACSEDDGKGIATAKKTLDADRSSMTSAAAVAYRRQRFVGDYNHIQGTSQSDYANQIFDLCYEQAVAGNAPNFTFGIEMTSAEVAEVRDGWRELGQQADTGAGSIHQLHSYPPENKTEKGKGNVGDTLGKRKFQADFLVYFGPRKFNAHVDVKG